MAYKFDSKWFQDPNHLNLHGHASDLVNKLGIARRDDPERPILFIGHSYGGLVIKQALILAKQRPSEHNPIPRDNIGIIFLGTPHRVPQQKVILSLGIRISGYASVLKTISDRVELTDLQQDFMGTTHIKPNCITCFFETKETKWGDWGLSSGILVDQSSACLDYGNTPIAMECNHSELNKFSSPSDSLYKKVVQELLKIYKHLDPCRVYEHPELKSFLSPLRPEVRHLDVATKLTEEQGKWLFDTPEFIDWHAGRGRPVLCCTGDPGVGKTSLVCRVIDHLRRSTNPLAVVLYIYCDYTLKPPQTANDLVGAMLSQLVSHLGPDHEIIKELQKHREESTPYSQEDMFSKIAGSKLFQRIWLCVDGLDELGAPEQVHLLDSLRKICQTATFRVFVTGRSSVQVKHRLEGSLPSLPRPVPVAYFNIPANERDLELYINEQLKKDPYPQYMNDGLEGQIRSEFTKRGSTILLTSLRLPLLLKKQGFHDREQALKECPSDVYDWYKKSLARMKDQLDQYGLDLLRWVQFAERPLTLQELRYALTIRPCHKDLSPEDLLSTSSILDSSLGLVAIDAEEKTARFIHTTLKDFLDINSSDYFPDSHSRLSLTILTYLNFDAMGNPDGRKRYQLPSGDLHPFAAYAAFNWGHHALKQPDEKVIDLVCKLPPGMFKALHEVRTTLYRHRSPADRLIGSRLWHSDSLSLDLFHFGALLIFPKLFNPLNQLDINATDRIGRTALSYAAECDLLQVVQALLQCSGINVNVADVFGRTPLLYAVKDRAVSCVQALLSHDEGNINKADCHCRTPLLYAIRQVDLKCVQELLKRDAIDVNLLDTRNGWTPLSHALFQVQTPSRDEVIQALMSRREIELSIRDKYGWTPLIHAVRCRRTENVRLLLQNTDIDVNFPDNEGKTPFAHAVGGAEDIIRLLESHRRMPGSFESTYATI
ncbi:hypothetical protein BJV78DRAFT_918834 [Lactifluus subvellereus]|nr:hypothetical protein BJV78DRAFT_918834 [Lactifluus subvellereus]